MAGDEVGLNALVGGRHVVLANKLQATVRVLPPDSSKEVPSLIGIEVPGSHLTSTAELKLCEYLHVAVREVVEVLHGHGREAHVHDWSE